jgi:tight adherence protein B
MTDSIQLGLIYLVVFIAVTMTASFLTGAGRVVFQHYQNRYVQNMSKTLETMFIFLNPKRIMNISIVAMFLAFLITLIVSRMNLFVSVTMGFVGLLVPRILLNQYMKKRKKTFERQFVQGLESLSSSVRAGLSLVQALESLVENSTPPLSQEFDLLLREYRIGIPLNEALQNLARRVRSDELNLMVYSVIITRELGGDVSEIFEHLAEVIRERHRVMERIETLTAQGRLQAVVCGAIPFFLYGLLFMWQPEFIRPLFQTKVGKIAIYAVCLLQVIVVLLVRKLISIRI